MAALGENHELPVGLPKIELKYEEMPNDALGALGMGPAFDDRADLSRLTPASVKIDVVEQNTFLKVDEEGTEAAAVTTVAVDVTSLGPSLVVDRPFPPPPRNFSLPSSTRTRAFPRRAVCSPSPGMKLTFLGTRGYIEPRTRRHRMHASLGVEYRGKWVMVDCGEDWLRRLGTLRPPAIVVTHAHPDHAGGLKRGAPCPVYATAAAWDGELKRYPIEERRALRPREPAELRGITFEAFVVEHSTRAPAVGYRITAGQAAIFYAPDLVYIRERREALAGVDIYVGDGATVDRPLVRRRGDALIGHTPVRTQLTWCRKEGVPRAIITHCGKQIVGGDETEIHARVRAMAEERGVEAEIAHDGLEVVV